MAELIVRPTMKFIKAAAVAAGVVVIGLEIAIWMFGAGSLWLMAIPPFLMLWPAARAIERRLTRISVSGERLRYETGFFSKTTRTIQLPKIQDVRVDQGIFQRLFNVGNLSIETAGETSRLTIDDVDSPQELADELLNRAQHPTLPNQKGGAT